VEALNRSGRSPPPQLFFHIARHHADSPNGIDTLLLRAAETLAPILHFVRLVNLDARSILRSPLRFVIWHKEFLV